MALNKKILLVFKNSINFWKSIQFNIKVILNPSMLATIDPMNLKQILILLKYPKHDISHQKVDDQLSNLWFINI